MTEPKDEGTEPTASVWADQGYSLYRIADALERIASALEGVENEAGAVSYSLDSLARRHGEDYD
jgi:hypothetical protein